MDGELRTLERDAKPGTWQRYRYRMALVRAGRAPVDDFEPGDTVAVDCHGERFQGLVGRFPGGLIAREITDQFARSCIWEAHPDREWTLVEAAKPA